MRLSLSFAVALTSLGTAILADSIAFGWYQGYGVDLGRIMWIEGQDPCDLSKQAHAVDCYNHGGLNVCDMTDNPCGHKFTLNNGKGYKVLNCGTADFSLHYFNSGTKISKAQYAPWDSLCGDSSGNHQVHKQWQFQCDKPGC
ncbi:hypothetical protein B0H66DRAFT_527041 [Apodospora peruviana]|uniref:Uncharacterized protein n=1 Tax=Apodospora peruviana TaxID=516989 RepID=A0AAE0MG07_9PEZI|nr:hypothetical protein B0H66DRAFT_527041 [Apodospora peruviana]